MNNKDLERKINMFIDQTFTKQDYEFIEKLLSNALRNNLMYGLSFDEEVKSAKETYSIYYKNKINSK